MNAAPSLELIDLRGMAYMPLHIDRLRRSKAWLICKRRPELAFHMLNLWMASWHEVPAGSLENDDDILADAAMCDVRKWPRVKQDVMRGWTLADDGRLYHETVREIALDTFEKRTRWRERKRGQRVGQTGLSHTMSPEDIAGTDAGHAVGQSEDNTLKGKGKGKGKTIPEGIDSSADAPRPPKGTRLPTDWRLPEDWHEWASHHWPHAGMDEIWNQADVFRDYWTAQPGQKGVKTDWPATWRNWIRRAAKGGANGGSRHYRKSGFDVVLDEIRSGASRAMEVDPD